MNTVKKFIKNEVADYNSDLKLLLNTYENIFKDNYCYMDSIEFLKTIYNELEINDSFKLIDYYTMLDTIIIESVENYQENTLENTFINDITQEFLKNHILSVIFKKDFLTDFFKNYSIVCDYSTIRQLDNFRIIDNNEYNYWIKV